MVSAYLSIGSNLGDRTKNCARAVDLLRGHSQIEIIQVSSLIDTPAMTLDHTPQPNYLNGVIALQTTLSPQELLTVCKEIETQLGRMPSEKRWQPRPIDLDILFYGNQTLQTPELTIPHPEIRHRKFLLQLLKEIGVTDENFYR